MNIIYVSNVCDVETYRKKILNNNNNSNFQAQKFNLLILKGLQKNNINVSVISGRPINQHSHKIKYYKYEEVREKKLVYHYIGFFNYKIIRQLFLFYNTKKVIKKITHNNVKNVMICDVLNYTTSYAAMKECHKKGIKIFGIITDLPEFISDNKNYIKRVNKLINGCDGYIFLSQEMNKKLNLYAKPYRVIEGFADIDMLNNENNLEQKYNKKVILYSGGLSKKYGLDILVEGFIKANIQDSELHLYGDGDYVAKIKEYAKLHTNVKYFGCVENSKIVEEQLKATLLVNPRPTIEEFVKYSFPSKNIEYMASGTPMLTTNLPSMPEEYKTYCYLLSNESVDGMAESIANILRTEKKALYEKGKAAKTWILQTKNNIIQTQKIVSLLEIKKEQNEDIAFK